MKKHRFGWKQALCAAAAAVVIIAAGFAIKALCRRGSAPATTETAQAAVTEAPAPTENEQTAATEAPEGSHRPPSWELGPNQSFSRISRTQVPIWTRTKS